ncbi:hypothetical protein [Pyxidicoccus xibeiensis]|uniref:hypothetical protein n=1 Tax=Pyxidicoccus xibeiensis TaxID=2906759 RepID=UPI0020A77852|nr:hypothetical protein [Pyxidicoccus xibeiensis]MCP3137224.1 hypothetical protein [Pyxidicoccus xibeiensis]
MVQHVGRLGRLAGLTAAVLLLACTPASAKEPQADAGTPAGKDAGPSTAAKDKDKPAPAPTEDAAKPSGGGSCTGKATLCAVYPQMWCSSQPGCSYSYARNACGGLAMQCEKATNQAFCQKIKGCKWQ